MRAAHLVNAAGLRSDEVDAMLGHSDFRVMPTARGADRLRQARARPAQPRPAAGPHREDQGRARLSDDLRQRPARADRRRRRATRPTARPPRPASTSLMEAGARILPRAGGARGDRHLRRAARGDRAPRLPAQRAPGPALRLRRRDPLDRASPDRWQSPSGCGRRWRRRRPRPRGWSPRRAASGCRTSASSGRAPTRRASGSRAIPTTAGSSASASGSPAARSTRALASPIPPVDAGRAAPADPCADGALPGLLLRGRGRTRDLEGGRMAIADGPVIVGGGPSGLAAAIELRELGISPVTVIEREREAGGIPRHSDHTGFGLRDLRTVLSGPRYARALSRARGGGRRRGPHRDDGHRLGGGPPAEADRAGWPRRRSSRPRWSSRPAAGSAPVPRASSPGSRPAGVMTTSTLQQLVHLEGRKVGPASGDRRRRARQLLGGRDPGARGRLGGRAGHGAAQAPVADGLPGRSGASATGRRSGRGRRSARSTARRGSSRSS